MIHLDPKRGHFVMEVPWANGSGVVGEVTAVDLGPVLHLSTTGAHLSPASARELAEALTWWANRKPVDVEPEVETEDDLLSLIGEVSGA